MITLLNRRNGLYLKETESKGRGLFCTDTIKKGDILETTPAIILNEKQSAYTNETVLENYVFKTGTISKKLREEAHVKKLRDTNALVMGIASYCNHDEYPNAEVIWDECDHTLYYILRATRSIPAGTEICTSYGQGWFEDRKNAS